MLNCLIEHQVHQLVVTLYHTNNQTSTHELDADLGVLVLGEVKDSLSLWALELLPLVILLLRVCALWVVFGIL